MTFHERQFRDALGLFATGVTVVTAEVDGVKLAATVSSFNAVSLSPPLVLFSIARKAASFAHWSKADSFAVMVLDVAQTETSSHFAKAGSDKWAGVTSAPGIASGAPILPDFIVSFECRIYARYDGGDHEIFVGHVLDLSVRNPSANPLIFYGGKYRALSAERADSPRAPDVWLYGW